MNSDKSSDLADVLAEQTFEFYKKIIKEANSNGDYVCRDPHEIIIPINDLILKVGKRK